MMRPLDAAALPLSASERADPLLLRFIDLYDRTTRAELVSDPTSWTFEEKQAYDADDWQAFSRMRGYSDQEIQEFSDWLDTAHQVIEKYGLDYALRLNFLVDQQTRYS